MLLISGNPRRSGMSIDWLWHSAGRVCSGPASRLLHMCEEGTVKFRSVSDLYYDKTLWHETASQIILALCEGNRQWWMDSPHKGLYFDVLMFSLKLALKLLTNGRVAGELIRHLSHVISIFFNLKTGRMCDSEAGVHWYWKTREGCH